MEPNDSSGGERGTRRPRPKRPTYLVVALVVAWFLGLGTLQEGYVMMRIARNPLAADSLNLPPGLREALVEGVAAYAHVALPTGIAQMLLGGTLVVVSAATLFGGRIPLSVALQVLLANALLAIIGYFLNSPMREALMEVLVQSPEFQAQATQAVPQNPEAAYVWFNRLNLLLHVGALSLAALALTRPRVRQFLAYSAAKRREH